MKKAFSSRDIQKAFRANHQTLLRLMQTPKARKGMQAAFNATPPELGRTAVKAARKAR